MTNIVQDYKLGGSPGLVVMGRDSPSKGRGFESVYWMDIFSHVLVVKIVMFVWKDQKNEKEGKRLAHFLKKDLAINGKGLNPRQQEGSRTQIYWAMAPLNIS